MLLESLVVFSCIEQKGCTESVTFYYATNPSFVELVQNNEKSMRRYLGAYTVDYVLPIAGAISNKEYYIKITPNWSINKENIRYTKEW